MANTSLPCGTLVEFSGPAGTVVAPVEDRGPYIAGRTWDLCPPAFVEVAGSLGPGVVVVRWRIVG